MIMVLFAFERMNVILGSFQTSNHDVTIQLMRKFMSMQDVTTDQWPEEFRTEFASLSLAIGKLAHFQKLQLHRNVQI